MKWPQPIAQFGCRNIRPAEIKPRLLVIESSMADQHQPKIFAVRGFAIERLFQLVVVGWFGFRLESDGDLPAPGGVASFLPEDGLLQKDGGIFGIAARTDDEQHGDSFI